MGSNINGQLGISSSAQKGCTVPTQLEQLSFSKISKCRAGQFSAALSVDGQLFVWGEGSFGKFNFPHRVKCGKNMDIVDI